jgi:hypothetical protein
MALPSEFILDSMGNESKNKKRKRAQVIPEFLMLLYSVF